MRTNRDDDGEPIVRAGQGRDRSELVECAVIGALLLAALVLILLGAK